MENYSNRKGGSPNPQNLRVALIPRTFGCDAKGPGLGLAKARASKPMVMLLNLWLCFAIFFNLGGGILNLRFSMVAKALVMVRVREGGYKVMVYRVLIRLFPGI